MSPAYLDNIAIQLFTGSGWQDLSQYVIEDIDFDWGILGNTPSDRMGYIGGMNFLLNNNSGLFTPGVTAGFERGAKVRLVLTFEGIPYVRFKGKISKIGLPYDAEEMSVVPVSVSDWFRTATKQKVLLQGIATNVTTAEAVEILLQNLSNPPDRLEIDYGNEVLASVFTTADPKSTVYSELSKLGMSEFSYAYLRKDRVYGETLRVERRHTRVGAGVSVFPKSRVDSDHLGLVGGDDFALIGGAPLALHQLASMTFNAMSRADVEYGSNLINELTVRHNPVKVDPNVSVLFSLDKPIYIAAGQTLLDFNVSYKDPTGGGARVNGDNMIAPVSGTDYRLYQNEDESGPYLTGNLTFTVEYGSAGATYKSMKNNSGVGAWLTRLQARGNAVLLYNPIEKVVSDQPSIDRFELEPHSINSHYQSNQNVTDAVAITILNQCKDNRVAPQKISLCANVSAALMMAFLTLDVGHLVPIREDEHSVDGNFYIQSVKGKITQDGFVTFDWSIVDALFANEAYWKLETAGYGELEATTIIAY
jgi:hypothetical protein